MARGLIGGGLVPSAFNIHTQEGLSSAAHVGAYGNNGLVQGYVIRAHFPEDRDAFPGATYITYDVIVPYSSGFSAIPILTNCRLAYPLGSPSDPTTAVLRCPVGWDGKVNDDFYNSTTAVLVLFQDGIRTTPWIIATADPRDKVDSKLEGYHFRTRYNGIETSINKEGEYTLTSTLETVDAETNKVATPDPDKAGTFIKIDKDGSVFLDTTVDYIAIDKVNHNLELYAQENTYIGSPVSARENLVLGQKLVAALTQLITLLITPPLTTPALPGQPLGMNPALVPLLQGWVNTYLGAPPSPTTVLAEKKFTE